MPILLVSRSFLLSIFHSPSGEYVRHWMEGQGGGELYTKRNNSWIVIKDVICPKQNILHFLNITWQWETWRLASHAAPRLTSVPPPLPHSIDLFCSVPPTSPPCLCCVCVRLSSLIHIIDIIFLRQCFVVLFHFVLFSFCFLCDQPEFERHRNISKV